MKFSGYDTRCRGAITLLVVMLVLLVSSALLALAFNLSDLNMRAVGNLEMRSAAAAAAEKEIARIASSHPGVADFHRAVRSRVDINLNGVSDFEVEIAQPECVRATPVPGAAVHSVTLDRRLEDAAWNTVWEIKAVARGVHTRVDVSVTRALRYFLTATQKNDVCV